LDIFKRKQTPQTNEQGHEAFLDQTLYTVPGTNQKITWADSIEGTLILGATGSGKSSGPGKFIARAMLRSGYGFCVLCAKPDERKRWESYIEAEGRSEDTVMFDQESGLQFDFLLYELKREGAGAGDNLNMINGLMNLHEQNKIYSGGGETKEEKFWDQSTKRLISRSISFLKLAKEDVSIFNIRKIIAHCFQGDEADNFGTAKSDSLNSELDEKTQLAARTYVDDLAKTNFFVHTLEKIRKREFQSGSRELEHSQMVIDYWLKEFPRMSEKTTSTIIETVMGIIEPFMNEGILNRQFSGGLSDELKPERIIQNSKIIIIDFPIKEYGLAGVYAASIYKTTFQTAMERRDIEKETDPKPAALWIDEYQNFCNPLVDSLFQTTARSAWAATVYITQNINNLYFVMGSQMPAARAKALLGNLRLKYFANNDDPETNHWASNMIGQHLTDTEQTSYGEGRSITKTKSQQMQYRLTPDHFTTLKTGRKANKYKVEVVIFKSGKRWNIQGLNGESEERNYEIVAFDQ